MRFSLIAITRYLSRAFSLSLSPLRKTKSPTEMAAVEGVLHLRALDLALGK